MISTQSRAYFRLQIAPDHTKLIVTNARVKIEKTRYKNAVMMIYYEFLIFGITSFCMPCNVFSLFYALSTLHEANPDA